MKCLWLFFLLSAALSAHNLSGSLSGTVQDTAGAVMARAKGYNALNHTQFSGIDSTLRFDVQHAVHSSAHCALTGLSYGRGIT